jgi:hypothetical protein
MSITPTWCDFKTYVEEIGFGRGSPARPGQCPFCEGARVWFNGCRRVLITLMADGQPHRPDDWVPLQRVRCGRLSGVRALVDACSGFTRVAAVRSLTRQSGSLSPRL